MRFDMISPKQAEIFKFMVEPYDALMCDGAVRSGKTIMMIIAFVDWAMTQFDGCNFGVCGKTVRSAERNVISPFTPVPSIRKKYNITYSRTLSLMTVQWGRKINYFYVFGGKDESSYTLIQGITLSGVLFDEVALMPKSFVEQAIARTLSVDSAKLWFNCNPENPAHWFYKEWIQQPGKHNAKHLHFLMEDNPVLSSKALKKAKESFEGVFYQRYVLGLWVAAEGIIYRQFVDNPNRYILKDLSGHIPQFATIGVDFGGNGSAHTFICTGFVHGYHEMVVLEEYYRKEIISPDQLEADFVEFVQMCKSKYTIQDGYCDSAEQTLIQGLRNALARSRTPLNVMNAEKKPINDRIRALCRLMGAGRFFVMQHCTHLIEALSTAVWDPKHVTEDVRLDNGTINIDSLDALEYSYERRIRELINAR